MTPRPMTLRPMPRPEKRCSVPHPSRALAGWVGYGDTPPVSTLAVLSFANAFLSVIPLRRICFCPSRCFSFCHSPQGNLLLAVSPTSPQAEDPNSRPARPSSPNTEPGWETTNPRQAPPPHTFKMSARFAPSANPDQRQRRAPSQPRPKLERKLGDGLGRIPANRTRAESPHHPMLLQDERP